jgi:hypothetical protein
MRHTLSQNNRISIYMRGDIRASLLYQLVTIQELPASSFKHLKMYIEKGRDLMDQIIREGIAATSGEAKLFFLSHLFGETQSSALQEQGTMQHKSKAHLQQNRHLPKAPSLRELIVQECNQLANRVSRHNQQEGALNTCLRNPALKPSCLSLDKRTVCLALEGIQKRIVQELFAFLKSRGCIPNKHFVLLADSQGIEIPANKHNLALLSSGKLLKEAADHIFTKTKYKIPLNVEEFHKAIQLPEDYKQLVVHDSNTLPTKVVADDAEAVQMCLRALEGRLVRSINGASSSLDTLFWYEDGVHTTVNVRQAVMQSIQAMNIWIRGANGALRPYSGNMRRLEACVKMVLEHNRLRQVGFHRDLWQSSVGHLAFEDGIFSFADQSFRPFFRPSDGPKFTMKISRQFPQAGEDHETEQELLDRVIKPMFPDEGQRDYFLHCLARALAGEIHDKKWYLCMGERDSGKGTLCNLLLDAFRPFVKTFDNCILMGWHR